MREQSYGVIPIYVIDGEKYFLLIQQYSGSWAFPKGHSESTETPLQSATRELEEETGITNCDILDDRTFSEDYVFMRNKKLIRKNVTYYIGFVKNQDVKIQIEEIKNYRWAKEEEAINLITFKQTKLILKDAIEYLKNI